MDVGLELMFWRFCEEGGREGGSLGPGGKWWLNVRVFFFGRRGAPREFVGGKHGWMLKVNST